MKQIKQIIFALLLLFVPFGVFAQNYERLNELEADTYGDFAQVNGDYQTMKTIRSHWVKEVQRLKSMKQLEFSLTGNNEGVLKVTIPARVLFAQNDTIMLSSADSFLRPLLRIVKGNEAVASVIIAGFSDNNGSEKYVNTLSGGRARQVHRWFARQGVGPSDIHSFGFGNRVPRNANETIAQREKNRRITLYFIPTKKALRWAKRGTL